jgi:CheY-like chemotaxis protein
MIFTDIQMPVMDGYEAAKKIRAMNRPYACEIPIVAMSANAFNEDILKSKKAGMNDHIAKPIDVDVLVKMLITYVK